MAQYKETVNTEKALNLIAKMLAGKIEQIDFTKIKVSDKDYSLLSIEELQKLEELEEIRQETLVSEKVLLDDNTINVHGIIYNTDLENSYYLRTIGLYANDPDEGEILYSITPASHADYVSTPNGNNITTIILDLKTVISGATVNLQGNPSALVDVSMLNKKLDRGEGLEEEFDTGVKIVNELKKKQNKEDSTLKTAVKTIVGAINELYNELVKKATKTQLGRIKVGNNLTVDEDGTLHGTPEYTHPTGNGNNHIPANGVSGNFLKWLSSGAAQWTNITWSDITGKPNSFTPSSHNHTKANITDFPASMKNPYALSIQLNSGTAYTYDGAATKNINITPASIGAADSSHTHTKANITDFPTSMKNPNALEIKMNGQNPVSYDGAAAKSINITASGIGAYTKTETDEKFKNFCPYAIGDIYLTTLSTNPATKYLGTTWQKIEGRFLLGTSGSGVSKATGGSNSKTITQANLPNVKLKVDSHNHSETAHDHYMFSSVYQNKTFKHITDSTVKNYSPTYRAVMRNTTDRDDYVMVGADGLVANSGKTSKGVGNTGTSAPNTSALGSGQAFDITPSYYTCHMWLRLT